MADIRESALAALQTGLFDVLAGIGLPVYSVLPQAVDGGSDAAFPHIQIDDPILGNWDTNTEDGHDIIQRLHVRWRGQSKLPGHRIMAEVYDAMHKQERDLNGWHMVLAYQENAFVTSLPDGSFDGVSEFRIIIEKS